MSKVLRFKRRVLRVLDPGRKNRDVLTMQPSGAVEINTARILDSSKGRNHVRTVEKLARDEVETA